MSEVTFEEERIDGISLRIDQNGEDETPTLIKLLTRMGFDEKRANLILISILLVCTVSTFLVILHKKILPKVKPRPTYIEEIPLEVRQKLPAEYFKDFPNRYDQPNTQ